VKSIKGCWAKIKYPSKEAANLACRDSEKVYGKTFRSYPCSERGKVHWHTTSTPDRKAK
jgi:hypothetical protein